MMAKEINNNTMATLFFVIFIVSFLIFAYTRYTMNVLVAIIALMLAIGFKTWYVIREAEEVVMLEVEEIGRVCRDCRQEIIKRSEEEIQ